MTNNVFQRVVNLRKQARGWGFFYATPLDHLKALACEVGELKVAVSRFQHQRQAPAGCVRADVVDEIGDVLFTAVALCHTVGVDPEKALMQACQKFNTRFNVAAQFARKANFSQSSPPPPDIWLAFWKQAKTLIKYGR